MSSPMTEQRPETLPLPGAKPPRMRRQFSLGGLLLFVLWAASAVFVWLNREPWALRAAPEGIYGAVRYSADGSRLLCRTHEGYQVFDAHTGAIVDRLGLKEASAWYWQISDDWTLLALPQHPDKGHERLDLVDVKTGAVEMSVEHNRIGRVRFAPGNERLYVPHEWGIAVYRPGQPTRERNLDRLYANEPEDSGTDDAAAKPAPPPSPKLRAAEQALRDARTIDELNAAMDAFDHLRHSTELTPYLASGNGLAIVDLVASDARYASVWDLNTGRRVAELEGFTEHRYGSGFKCSDDGRTVAAQDEVSGATAVWALDTGRRLSAWTVPVDSGEFPSLALSRDGRVAAVTSSKRTRLWDCASGRERAGLPATHVEDFSPDGTRALCSERVDPNRSTKDLVFVDTASGERLYSVTAPPCPCRLSVQFGPDGRSMVALGETPGSSKVHLYARNHVEGPYGLLALPVTWALIALTLVQLVRFARWIARRKPAADRLVPAEPTASGAPA